MKKQTIAAVSLLVASVILAVVSIILLPDTVITQFSTSGGASSTMPKLLAVSLPTLLGAGGAIACIATNADKKAFVVSAVGIFVFVFMLIVNL